MMKILTVPSIIGGDSHLIPLYVLHKRYIAKQGEFTNYFLVNKNKQEQLKLQGVNVVDCDYEFGSVDSIDDIDTSHVFEKEIEAYNTIKPELLIEDNNFSSLYLSKKKQIPRVSIHRTGFFRSIDNELRNPKHVHSFEKGYSHIRNTNENLFTKEYLNAEAKIIPGIPTIEKLPDTISNKESYFYSGPLLIEDRATQNLVNELDCFFRLNKKKKKVFITTGLIDQTSISELIKFLLSRNYAVLTTYNDNSFEINNSSFFKNRLLPLNYVCSNVDLIIHQCGSGMYHYPILHEKPSMTIGTMCYDREDVALRLQELNISKHIPNVKDNSDYLEVFEQHINDFEKGALINFEELQLIKREVYETMLEFDLEKVINFAINNKTIK